MTDKPTTESRAPHYWIVTYPDGRVEHVVSAAHPLWQWRPESEEKDAPSKRRKKGVK